MHEQPGQREGRQDAHGRILANVVSRYRVKGPRWDQTIGAQAAIGASGHPCARKQGWRTGFEAATAAARGDLQRTSGRRGRRAPRCSRADSVLDVDPRSLVNRIRRANSAEESAERGDAQRRRLRSRRATRPARARWKSRPHAHSNASVTSPSISSTGSSAPTARCCGRGRCTLRREDCRARCSGRSLDRPNASPGSRGIRPV